MTDSSGRVAATGVGEAGVRGRQRTIAGSGWWTASVILVGLPLLHLQVVSPPVLDGLAERLGFAARCNAIALVPYFAVCVKILASRFLEGAHDPLTHPESAALKIDCRVMQNHLEQFIAFAVASTALAAMLPAGHLQLLPIATGVFVAGRLLYWWGYHRKGTLGRAPGVQLTFGVTIPLVSLAAVMAMWQGFGG